MRYLHKLLCWLGSHKLAPSGNDTEDTHGGFDVACTRSGCTHHFLFDEDPS